MEWAHRSGERLTTRCPRHAGVLFAAQTAQSHSWFAVIGPAGERSITVETGNSDQIDTMCVFTIAALDLLEKNLA